MDGVLDAWDLLQQQNEPILSIKVCDEPLLCKLIAIVYKKRKFPIFKFKSNNR